MKTVSEKSDASAYISIQPTALLVKIKMVNMIQLC